MCKNMMNLIFVKYIEGICQEVNMCLILAQERRWLERKNWELPTYKPEMEKFKKDSDRLTNFNGPWL